MFVHLKTHTEYSIVDGLLRIKSMVRRAQDLQMPAIAITDRMNLFGLVKFYKAALAAGVKPIIGAELEILDGENSYFLTALCQNQQGYLNLTRLITKAYLEGQAQQRPMIQFDWLAQANQGLIILSGASKGDLGAALLSGNKDQVRQRVQWWRQYFPDRYYMELRRTGRANEPQYLRAAVKLALKEKLPVVATNDACFLDKDDFEAHEARVCIATSYVLEDSRRPRLYSEQQYLRSAEEMSALFKDLPEAIQNSSEIAKRCNVQLELGRVCLPDFPVPENVGLETYLAEQSQLGLAQRLKLVKNLTPELEQDYQERLKTELDVICKMGFPGYFLIVADFINWAKQNGIPVGPGRGSGAGSLVAYCLGITMLDPLEHELLFERFLNPERVSMPDFDIDFCMERRDEVIDYVAQRYGRDAVSQIITYGTMAARAVVRDVGRVLGMPYGYVDKIAKLIPFEIGMTLDKALEQEEALQELYDKEEEVATLINLAKKLEGVTRNAGKHAGGVVIAPTTLTDFAPLYCEPGGTHPVTQFDKDDVEAVGLVKFDFLGLRTLTIIDWALRDINARRKKEGLEPIDIDAIPLDDEKPFKLLHECATTAVFQLESRGMKELIRRLRPDSFEEITALVALFRPGPLQSGMVDDFIDRKHGRAKVEYPHPEVEPILRPTYGVILYQEQVMQIAQVLAGYSLGGADILRRAMGKKKPEEMAKQRAVFIDGATKRGIDAGVAQHIFDLMEKFAGYGFNKSHSAAYALIAYQTAWLKAHYPAEFMAAVLSSDMDNTDKVVSFLDECSSMQLKVIPPCINRGFSAFTVNDAGEIEYGLSAVKGVGLAAVEQIVAEREANGPYRDLFDFCQRLDGRKVNKRVIEPLIRSGAMDVFAISRESLMATLQKAMKAAEQKARNASVGQNDLFADAEQAAEANPAQEYLQAPKWDPKTKLSGEKDVLGWYVSGHPIQSFAREIKKVSKYSINSLIAEHPAEATIAALIVSIRHIMTKKGKRMAVITLEDQSGRIEVTIFSKLLEECQADLQVDNIVVVSGKVEDDDYTGGVRMVAETLQSLNDKRRTMARRLVIHLDSQQQVHDKLSELAEYIRPHMGGNCPVVIAYKTEQAGAELSLGEAWNVNPENQLLSQLRMLCGDKSVVVEY